MKQLTPLSRLCVSKARVVGFCCILMCFLGCADEANEETANDRVGISTLREPFHKSDQSCGPYPNYYFEYMYLKIY